MSCSCASQGCFSASSTVIRRRGSNCSSRVMVTGAVGAMSCLQCASQFLPVAPSSWRRTCACCYSHAQYWLLRPAASTTLQLLSQIKFTFGAPTCSMCSSRSTASGVAPGNIRRKSCFCSGQVGRHTSLLHRARLRRRLAQPGQLITLPRTNQRPQWLMPVAHRPPMHPSQGLPPFFSACCSPVLCAAQHASHTSCTASPPACLHPPPLWAAPECRRAPWAQR